MMKKQHQNGSMGGAEQLLGPFGSRLYWVVALCCMCSCCVYIVLLFAPGGHSDVTTVNYSDVKTVNCSDAISDQFLHTDSDLKKGTSLDRIVFGIGASAHLWTTRSQYLNLWWKRGVTRGFVWVEEELGKDWKPGVDPDYKVSQDTSQFKYTHKSGVRGRSALRISRIVSETFRLGLPDVDWFVMGDDDTFFFTDNLVGLLNKYDPTKLWYIGSNSEDDIQNQLYSYSMAYGGGGFAISYPLAALLAEQQDDCIRRYPELFGSDDRMKACMSELGVPLTKERGFHQFDIKGNVEGFLSAHPTTPIITLHHLDAITPLFPDRTRAQSLAHLVEALKASPHNIFQQSICYDTEMKWSFSVSWGFVIHVYMGFIPPHVLEVPEITFQSWHRRRDPSAFPFSARPRLSRDSCGDPFLSYYFDQVEQVENSTMEDGLTLTSYRIKEERPKACELKLMPMSLVKKMVVQSDSLGEDWVQNPRRQCCRVDQVRKNTLSLQVRQCGDGETTFPQVVAG